jgi:hypothetical protein
MCSRRRGTAALVASSLSPRLRYPAPRNRDNRSMKPGLRHPSRITDGRSSRRKCWCRRCPCPGRSSAPPWCTANGIAGRSRSFNWPNAAFCPCSGTDHRNCRSFMRRIWRAGSSRRRRLQRRPAKSTSPLTRPRRRAGRLRSQSRKRSASGRR